MFLPVEKKPYVLNLKNGAISDKGKKEGITSLGKRNIEVLGLEVTGVKSGGLRSFFISLGQKILHSNSKNPPKSEGAYKWTKIKGGGGAKYWVKTEELAGHFGVTDFSSKKTEKIVPNTNNIKPFEIENIPMEKGKEIYPVKEKEIVKKNISKTKFDELSEKIKNLYSFLEIKSYINHVNENQSGFIDLFVYQGNSKIIIKNTPFEVDLASNDYEKQITQLKNFVELRELAGEAKYCPFSLTKGGYAIGGIELPLSEEFHFINARLIVKNLKDLGGKNFKIEDIKFEKITDQQITNNSRKGVFDIKITCPKPTQSSRFSEGKVPNEYSLGEVTAQKEEQHSSILETIIYALDELEDVC